MICKTCNAAPRSALFFLDEALRIREYSIAAANIFNLLPQDIGRPVEHLLYNIDVDYDTLRQAADVVLADGTAIEKEVQSGAGTYFLLRILPYRIDTDLIAGIVLTLINITERKAVQLALGKSEERFRATFDQAAVGISHMAPGGKILRVNQKQCDIIGYTREELSKLTMRELTHPNDLDLNNDYVQQILNGQIKMYALEKRYIHKSGSHIWVNLTVSLIRDVSGEPKYFICVAEDISQRKATEQALQQQAEKNTVLLQEVNHRVKNNLAAIIGSLYIKRRRFGLNDSVIYQALTEDIISQIQGLATVHNMLSAAEWSPLPLSQLTEQIVHSSLRTLSHSHPTSVEITRSAVKVTPEQANNLALVINELATNTIKYAAEDETKPLQISANISLIDEQITFEYRDNGPGYPDAVLKLDEAAINVGFELIANVVKRNLQGHLSLKNEGGAVTEIRFGMQV